MISRSSLNLALSCWLALLAVQVSAAAEAAQAEMVAAGLRSPIALSVLPGSPSEPARVFLIERDAKAIALWEAGQGAVRRDLAEPPSQAPDGSPSAMALLTPRSLAVAWHRAAGRFAGIAVYEVVAGGSLCQTAFREPAADAEALSEGPIASLLRDDRYLYATGGSASRRVFARARHNSGMLGQFRSAESLVSDGAVPMGFSPRGYLIGSHDGRLCFFDPAAINDGPRLELESGLPELRAVAYSPLPNPDERQLYAASPDGVFRLDAKLGPHGKLACRATPVARIERPVAMAFAPNGVLYVATAGDAPNAGSLYAIKGGL